MQDDHNKFYKLRTYMAMQKRAWMTSLLFIKFLFFFKKFVIGTMFSTNRHLLVLDGHDNHVSLEMIEQA